jgi:hypothetical protein
MADIISDEEANNMCHDLCHHDIYIDLCPDITVCRCGKDSELGICVEYESGFLGSIISERSCRNRSCFELAVENAINELVEEIKRITESHQEKIDKLRTFALRETSK